MVHQACSDLNHNRSSGSGDLAGMALQSNRWIRWLDRLPGWRGVAFTLGATLCLALLLMPVWQSGRLELLMRMVAAGLSALLVYRLLERHPRRLPRWCARWVLQVIGVALSIPCVYFLIYLLSTSPDQPPFWTDVLRLGGFGILSVTGLLLAPWIALGALVRQKDALARHQALAFDLERTELERQALDARLRLLQAQVTPHFLFNTLANVQALVDTGSPQASQVLGSLIAYLRATVPRLDQAATTLGQEVQMVRAYLELMHMRIPDRLQFNLTIDPEALALICPPMTLMTLVENAVRHGIDPSEDGGRIDVVLRRQHACCQIIVSDTGLGWGSAAQSLGTGLASLRERLALVFGVDVQWHCDSILPRGARVQIEFPARMGAG